MYRGKTYEAENADVITQSRNAIIACNSTFGCSNGKRVGYFHGDNYVQFNNVSASSGSMDLMIYYTFRADHDRYYRITVNGKLVSTSAFPSTGSNGIFSNQRVVHLTGFTAGTKNSIRIQGPGDSAADSTGPDLDFIETIPAT